MKDPKAFNFDGDYGEEYKGLASCVIPGYDEFFVATLALMQECIVPKAQILIVGCGTGKEIEVFAPDAADWEFDCVDPSQAMIEHSRKVAQRLGVSSRVRFHHAYTHELEIDYRFEAATVINVMHFLLDDGSKDEFMKSVAQRVKPGGSVILFDLHGNRSENSFKLLYNAWIRYMDLRGYTGQKKEKLLQRLETGIAYVGSDRILQICQNAGLKLIRSYWGGFLYTAWLFERTGSS